MILTPGSKRFFTSSLSSRKSRVSLRLSMARLTSTKHLVKIKGLGDVIEGAVLHGADGIAHGVLRGHQDHRRIDAASLISFSKIRPSASGNLMSISETSKCVSVSSWRARGAIGRGLHPIAFVFEGLLQHEAQRFFVFRNQDFSLIHNVNLPPPEKS